MKTTRSTSSALRIGILGCANIARQFARDVAPSRKVRVDAVASRNAETAAAFAADHAIGRHHGTYEALLSDPDIDAIYIPLPNSLHAEWAIRAAEAGKHVLCEKPLALGAAEARSMFDAAARHGVMLLEAYPYYFQPQTGDMLALLREGAIGTVRSVQASFGFNLAKPQGNIRMNPELGGGALLDAGSYPLSLIRLVMGCAPQRVQADASWADSGVDISLAATLFYADGRRAQFDCAMDSAMHRRAMIAGTQGTIETEFLNHTSAEPAGDAHGYLPSQLRLRRGTAGTVPFENLQSATGSGFRFAAEAFAAVIARRDFDGIARAAAASIDIAATIEALAQSAKLGRAIDVQAG
ncbi:Glucose--fructose oxidoreductase precursor [Variovorax sp. SRS16]|uniref:Gfo/Idh/MocA family protein n=1 Tax=Variovorax sp. SRS16 TaxID=282217 RepID=UPI001318015A|nr:Gfo/Idh/MocA family oxidoreductase [Variovorax sp. SRS16]VTU17317.1 Glucose--fructose oxidoreductase precursor [Variovorax sp. SRS16]